MVEIPDGLVIGGRVVMSDDLEVHAGRGGTIVSARFHLGAPGFPGFWAVEVRLDGRKTAQWWPLTSMTLQPVTSSNAH